MISCEKYDYIEIACMHRYPVRLTMKSGTVLTGVALDTSRDESRRECIVLDSKELVVLDEISTLEVCVDNPHFDRVSFS